ncbi:hypothetical protein [uncultured Jatrophihabitans sp.]|uniref:hypothetical protein n=1 Tax=uncultured Jatrophihabitans sp. TaxID=1610747 RepID=UPI0035CA1138
MLRTSDAYRLVEAIAASLGGAATLAEPFDDWGAACVKPDLRNGVHASGGPDHGRQVPPGSSGAVLEWSQFDSGGAPRLGGGERVPSLGLADSTNG